MDNPEAIEQIAREVKERDAKKSSQGNREASLSVYA